MSRKHSGAIPDFSRKRPLPGAKSIPVNERQPMPAPKQPVQKPTKPKSGGRRGS